MPPLPPGWADLTDVRLPRLGRRVDRVIVTPGAVLVIAPDRAAAEAAAIDLADFHAGCRGVPVIPIAFLAGTRVVAQAPLPFPGAAPVIACTRLLLPGLLAQVARLPPVPGLDPASWAAAAYEPVPALLRAACALYAGHGAESLLLATSGRTDLAATRAAILTEIAAARTHGQRRAVFVTGQPGAGKTLCGLDIAFDPTAGAAFLTGNPALVHVLREALARDAASRGLQRRAARQRIEAVIQPLHAFRDHYLTHSAAPPDRILVIDEAQRCWTAGYAIGKTRNRAVRLTDSEPGHILDIMARHAGWCAVICLLGGGQEIHAGEGGLAAWSAALATRPGWHAAGPASGHADPRQRLAGNPRLSLVPALHLGRPARTWRAPRLSAWAEALLGNDAAAARAMAGPDLPVRLTRSLSALRRALHGHVATGPACGLVASAGARRLRAEGLGAVLPHQDEDAVARWFLDAWPDIRSAEALEVAATEFGIQGLELDRIGLCWDQDLARTAGGTGWEPRAFRASRWTAIHGADARSNKLNAYRVLLTRARRGTVIWVPRGDPRDPTRDPARYEAVADYLMRCGVALLDEDAAHPHSAAMPEPVLL